MGTTNYFLLLDAGRRDKPTNRLISLKSYGSDAPISLNQNLEWPRSDPVKQISFMDRIVDLHSFTSPASVSPPTSFVIRKSKRPESTPMIETTFTEPQLISDYPEIVNLLSPMNSFCNSSTLHEPNTNQQFETPHPNLFGAYRYDHDSKKITFELKLRIDEPNEDNQTPLQMIVLGFSEDDKWGDDLIISCDLHPHISAFGRRKVTLFTKRAPQYSKTPISYRLSLHAK